MKYEIWYVGGIKKNRVNFRSIVLIYLAFCFSFIIYLRLIYSYSLRVLGTKI